MRWDDLTDTQGATAWQVEAVRLVSAEHARGAGTTHATGSWRACPHPLCGDLRLVFAWTDPDA